MTEPMYLGNIDIDEFDDFEDEPEFENLVEVEMSLKFSDPDSIIGSTIIKSDDDSERYLIIAPHTKNVIGELFIFCEDD